MYDALVRAQRPSVLEWLVVNALIPSVLITLVLQSARASRLAATTVIQTEMCVLAPLDEPAPGGPIPDVFPVLIRIHGPIYPPIMRRLRVEGRVVLRALVNPKGRVDSASILVVQTTHGEFVPPAFRALAGAVFRPARFAGHTGAAWITIGIDFNLNRE